MYGQSAEDLLDPFLAKVMLELRSDSTYGGAAKTQQNGRIPVDLSFHASLVGVMVWYFERDHNFDLIPSSRNLTSLRTLVEGLH